MNPSKFLLIPVALSLAACGSTEAFLAGTAVAGGIVSSMTSSPDYAKYADTCKDIINSAGEAAKTEALILSEAAKTEANGVLLYLAMKPKTSVFAQCALAMPKSFLTTLAESGNLLNFVATIYGVNRNSRDNQRSLDANKEISLANMEHQQEMTALQNALLTRLSNNTLDAINAVKPAPTAPIAP